MKYAFILGRNPGLSIAELGSIFGEKLTVGKDRTFASFDGELPQKPQAFLDRLGGTVEILEIFEENFQQTDVLEAILKFLIEQCRARAGKCAFALNLWPENKKSQVLKFLLPGLKKSLRANGISANFMNKNFQNVSQVLASKHRLIDRKTNIGIFDVGDGKISLGTTVALQDFEAYAKRDYGKPFRDPATGMLPPKLAQIMINLGVIASEHSAAKQSHVIFDPFCGTGTILIEAMLMGYSVIGSDADARLVEGARKNVDWMGNTKVQLFQKDATKLEAADVPINQPLAIITEPYLGPPLSAFPAENFLSKLRGELEKLYVDFFKNLSRWLPKKTPVVFTFPYWKKNGQEKIRLADGLVEKIESLGYSKTAFAPLQTTSLFYDRSEQIVGREIIRFIKNNTIPE